MLVSCVNWVGGGVWSSDMGDRGRGPGMVSNVKGSVEIRKSEHPSQDTHGQTLDL